MFYRTKWTGTSSLRQLMRQNLTSVMPSVSILLSLMADFEAMFIDIMIKSPASEFIEAAMYVRYEAKEAKTT